MLDIHVDVERDSTDWPLLGFILMIDAFTLANGATRFIPGSHHWGDPPRDGRMQEYIAQLVSACGPAGSLLLFNGSEPRRQAAADQRRADRTTGHD